MLNKLRAKFIVINMAIVLAMLVVIFGLVYHFTDENLENQSISMVKTVAQSATKPGGRVNVRLPYFTLQINIFGEVVASGSSYFDLTDQAFLQALINEVYSSEASMGVIKEHSLRYCRTAGMGSQTIAFVDISSQQATLALLVQVSILVGAVSLIVFFLISFWLARWAVKPVEKAWQQQKQFVSDASHELKTPLTVIMNNAQLLQSEEETQSRQQLAAGILTMSRQMRKLIEGLLELSRADNGYMKKDFAQLDLSRLVESALLPFEPVFYERGLFLSGAVESGITVFGSEQHLRQVVDILLDNALKYSAQGAVSVQLRRQGRTCLLSVTNPGTPIPAAELERIFERFYRQDQARSERGSFGLGLSIAKSITREHGGRIWAQSNSSGNCFCVQLPVQ